MAVSFPLIIHQTWNDENVPQRYQPLVEGWKRLHPNWNFRLWTHEMNDRFVVDNFPEFLPVYKGYKRQIQRIDAARYLILYKMGGVHLDLDIECIKNIEPLLEGDFEFVIGKEPDEHCREHDKDMILSNAFIASMAGSPFLSDIISSLQNRFGETDNVQPDSVLQTTGPFMVTQRYLAYPGKEKIKILDSSMVCPLTKSEIYSGSVDIENHDRLKKAFAIHYFDGVWWR